MAFHGKKLDYIKEHFLLKWMVEMPLKKDRGNFKMKQRMQGLIAGIFVMVLLLGTVTVFAATSRTIEVTFGNFRTYLFGQEFISRNEQGEIVQPFMYNGSLYVPVESILHAMGDNISWDETNGILHFGNVTAPGVTQEVSLFNRPFTAVGAAFQFASSGDTDNNLIILMTRHWHVTNQTQENYVVYSLDATATRFTGSVNATPGGTAVYRFLGDGRLLHTSPSVGTGTPLIPFDIDVSGVRELRIEVVTTGHLSFHANSTHGIVNAVIVQGE